MPGHSAFHAAVHHRQDRGTPNNYDFVVGFFTVVEHFVDHLENVGGWEIAEDGLADAVGEGFDAGTGAAGQSGYAQRSGSLEYLPTGRQRCGPHAPPTRKMVRVYQSVGEKRLFQSRARQEAVAWLRSDRSLTGAARPVGALLNHALNLLSHNDGSSSICSECFAERLWQAAAWTQSASAPGTREVFHGLW
jgi:hypothetical protein